MAVAFPSAILHSVLKQLESPVFLRNNVNQSLAFQLRGLRSKLELIETVIYDAELMGILFPKFLREWVCELERILRDVYELLDEALTRSVPENASMLEKVRLRLHNVPFQHLKLVHKMKNLNERLEGIVKECYKCNLLVAEHGGGGSIQKPVARRGIIRYDPKYAKDDEFHMIGRDDDKKKVIQMLFAEDPTKLVVWISGPPGVGKTTLGRAVYDDKEVKDHFGCVLWVDLRRMKDFSLKELLRKIIEALHVYSATFPGTEDEQMLKIAAFFMCTKTLFVFDGLLPRGPNISDFNALLNYVLAWSKVSKILVLKTCTEAADHGHELKNDLSQEQSWSIFKNMAFVPRHDTEPWVEDLGRQIVSRCPGNPALLGCVGTLLRGKVSEDDRATWEYFAREFDYCGQYHHYLSTSILQPITHSS